MVEAPVTKEGKSTAHILLDAIEHIAIELATHFLKKRGYKVMTPGERFAQDG